MVNLEKYNIRLLIDFDSTFIKEESLEIISEISLKYSQNSDKTINKIKELTSLAMNGKISFSEALITRIQLLKANKEHISLAIQKIKNGISNSFIKNKDFFHKNHKNCYIISGGFSQIIKPVIQEFNISEKNIFANELIFNKQGYITSINKNNPLSKDLGKITISKKIEGEKIIIGDGYTDYEIKKHGFASKFIQYTENINREELNINADFISKDLHEALLYINKIYQNGK